MPKRDEKYMVDRRDEILDATQACLVRNGLAKLSTTALCEEAGISMGALYTHFSTKDEILVALAERSAQRRREALTFHSLKELRQHFVAQAEAATSRKTKDAFRVDLELLVASYSDERIAKALLPFRNSNDLAQALKALQATDEIDSKVDPQAAATALEALLMGVRVLSLIGGRPASSYRDSLEILLDSLTD
jgi:AcrR family transcriptional regulator